LKEINVSEENKTYSSFEGVLFDKTQEKLLRYPAAKSQNSYTVPESVSSIGTSAFENNKIIGTVSLPENCSQIEPFAFKNCNHLDKLYFYNKYCEIYMSGETVYEDTQINGYKDSTAQYYAECYDRDFVEIGKVEPPTAAPTSPQITPSVSGVYAIGHTEDGFYFNHDTREFDYGHPDDIELVVVDVDGASENIELDKSLVEYKCKKYNARTPHDTFSIDESDFTYDIAVYYNGEPLMFRDGTPVEFKAYIGVKDDTNFDNMVNSVDATNLLHYYADISIGGTPDNSLVSEEKVINAFPELELDDLAAFLGDTDNDIYTKENWKMRKCDRIIDARDASATLGFYSDIMTGVADRNVAWNNALPGREELQSSPSGYDFKMLTAVSADGGFIQSQIDNSTIKPKAETTRFVVKPDQIGKTVEIKVFIDGANAKYCSTGIHFYYDERLQIEKDSAGKPKVYKASEGECGSEYLGTICIKEDPTADDLNTDATKFDGLFFAAAESSNKGLNGLLFKMNFTLPEDAQPGDEKESGCGCTLISVLGCEQLRFYERYIQSNYLLSSNSNDIRF